MFADSLKRLMKEKRYSAKAVSDATGIPQSALSEYCSGREPKIDALLKLARFFGVSVEALVTGEDPAQEAITEIMTGAGNGWIEVHQGTYRLKIEKYSGVTVQDQAKRADKK